MANWPDGLDDQPIDNSSLYRSSAAPIRGLRGLTVGPTMYNIRNDKYANGGCKGDGSTNDEVALLDCIEDARAHGGGIIHAPPPPGAGAYMVEPTFISSGYAAKQAIPLPSNTIFRGGGAGKTLFKFIPGMSANAVGGARYMIGTYSQLNDHDILVEDMTLDGNGTGAGNTAPDGFSGTTFDSATGITIQRVSARNFYTSATGEQGNFQMLSCTKSKFIDCDGDSMGLLTCSGIQLSGCTAVDVISCTGQGMAGVWRSFVADGCRNCSFLACYSFLNPGAGVGFSAQNCVSIRYTNCVAGGNANVQWQTFPAPYPFGFSQNLGNGGYGWDIGCPGTSGDIVLDKCVADNNGASGVQISGANAAGVVSIISGRYTSNGAYGILMNSTSACQTKILDRPQIAGNVSGQIFNFVLSAAFSPASVVTPAVPATGNAFMNNYGIDATVYIKGGTLTGISINGAATGITAAAAAGAVHTLRVPAGQTITWTGTVAPTWAWQLD